MSNLEDLDIVDVPIDENVVVQCPDKAFSNRRAAKCCPSCPHFKGVVRAGLSDEWSDSYHILCARPMTRKTYTIKVLEE